MINEHDLQLAVEAVELHGSIAEAARHLNVPRKTLSDHYHAAQGQKIKTKKVKKSDAAEEKQLRKIIESQAERIDLLKKTRFKVPKQSRPPRSKKFWLRAIIPDTHGSHEDPVAVNACLEDIASLGSKIREVVLLGDHMDCGGFLAQHHAMGYVADTAYSFDDDQIAANIFLDRLQPLVPKADIHYLEGNHERRIEKWCVTQALSNNKDAAYLSSLFSTHSVLSLAKRGIKYYAQGKFYDGCRVPSTIKLGKCYFTHGHRTGKNPARLMLTDFAANVFFGHVHTADMAADRKVSDGEIIAATPGCLCRQQPLWMHTNPTNWTHGFGLQIVCEDDGFLNINAPIIGDRSYLSPLVANLI